MDGREDQIAVGHLLDASYTARVDGGEASVRNPPSVGAKAKMSPIRNESVSAGRTLGRRAC